MERLYRHGTMDDGALALACLLKRAAAKLGKDQREKADGFCERLRGAAAQTAAAPPVFLRNGMRLNAFIICWRATPMPALTYLRT